ncbi:MAG: adenylate/guanylate cyclase domain-containing protein [Vulcanimicrobiota bacterium]
MRDDATINIEGDEAEGREFVRTGYDLVLISSDGAQSRFPICYSEVTVGGAGEKHNDIELEAPGVANRQLSLSYKTGRLFYTNLNVALPVALNGQVSTFRELQDQDELELAGCKLRVVGLMDQLASLEGYSDPYRGHRWAIGREPVTIGRAGKRDNVVSLEDRTVSRTQATIRLHEGTFVLEPETTSSPVRVNGDKVEQSSMLSDGDLIQLGQQLLRFRTAKGSSRPRNLAPQEATILFSDIWNYSSLAESRPLEETIHQMNEFYGAMGKVIQAGGGFLMTFLGDALMAVFGAESKDDRDPQRAVETAVAMQKRLEELNQDWSSRGMPTMQIGVGINTGEVMVGDVGFTGKFEFAAMGDNTNLAARLEKLTREFKARIIVSGSTHKALTGGPTLSYLGTTRVKGRETPVELYGVEL